jgi:hypothetical protein
LFGELALLQRGHAWQRLSVGDCVRGHNWAKGLGRCYKEEGFAADQMSGSRGTSLIGELNKFY